MKVWSIIKRNRSCNHYQCRLILLGGFKREKQLKVRWIKLGSRLVDLFDWRAGLKMFIWQMTECHKFLMKEPYNTQQFNIYWILEKFLEKTILRKMYALYFKWLLWDFSLRSLEYGQVMVKSCKLQQRCEWAMLFDTFINMVDQYVYTFAYQKPILNLSSKNQSGFKLHPQTSRGPLSKSFFHYILEL